MILAPMAGITDVPFRRMARRGGAGGVYSEMVSSEGLIRRQKGSLRYLATHAQEQPLMIQIFGHDPEAMAEAAQMAAEHGAAGIDINMGCPVRKVNRSGSGCALMGQPQLAECIIRQVRQAVSLPLTVKIRSGWRGECNFLQIGRIAQDCGADAIILHPRLGSQGFTGISNWEHIAQLKASVNCPVIGNGDIHTPEDARRMLTQTGCDAVMVGRASRGRPWLFGQIDHYLKTGKLLPSPDWSSRWQIMCEHLRLLIDFHGPNRGVLEARKHIVWYTQGLPHAVELRQKAFKIVTPEELFTALDDFIL